MAIIKLPNAGDELTALVDRCEVVESPRYKNTDGTPVEQVKFTMANGNTLFMGRDTAERQLLRCGFGDGEQVFHGEVDGQWLRFSRDPNKNDASKPYWAIDKAQEPKSRRAAAGLPANAAEAAKAPPPDDADFAEMMDDGDETATPDSGSEKQLPRQSIADQKAASIDAHYLRAWNVALEVQGRAGSPDSLQAAAATLMIAYNKAGVC